MKPTAEEKQQADDLAAIVTASIATIDAHIKALNSLPLQPEYREELLKVLRRVNEALVALEPIVSKLEQVRSLIIAPVKEGVQKAFDESNKWGVLGLKVAVLSMVLSAVLAIPTIIPYLKSEDDVPPPVASTAKTVTAPTPQPCTWSDLDHVLFGADVSTADLYLLGKCFLPADQMRVIVGGIDVRVNHESASVLSITALPPRVAGVDPRVVIRAPLTFSDASTGKNPITFADYYVRLDGPTYDLVASIEEEVALGDNAAYFGDIHAISGERAIGTFGLARFRASDFLPRAYIVVSAYGIGPGVGENISESGVSVNGVFHDFEGTWPYWKSNTAGKYFARFAVPIAVGELRDGVNEIEFVSGRYTRKEGVGLDNYVVTKVEVFTAKGTRLVQAAPIR